MKHHRAYWPPTSTPVIMPRLPAGVPAAILARRAAMIEAGTHPVLAGRLAFSAGENQAAREGRSSVSR